MARSWHNRPEGFCGSMKASRRRTEGGVKRKVNAALATVATVVNAKLASPDDCDVAAPRARW